MHVFMLCCILFLARMCASRGIFIGTSRDGIDDQSSCGGPERLEVCFWEAEQVFLFQLVLGLSLARMLCMCIPSIERDVTISDETVGFCCWFCFFKRVLIPVRRGRWLTQGVVEVLTQGPAAHTPKLSSWAAWSVVVFSVDFLPRRGGIVSCCAPSCVFRF